MAQALAPENQRTITMTTTTMTMTTRGPPDDDDNHGNNDDADADGDDVDEDGDGEDVSKQYYKIGGKSWSQTAGREHKAARTSTSKSEGRRERHHSAQHPYPDCGTGSRILLGCCSTQIVGLVRLYMTVQPR